MKYELTKFHTLHVKTVWYTYETDSWNCEYVIYDSITKTEKKDTHSFDRWCNSPKESAQFVADQLCKYLKDKMSL